VGSYRFISAALVSTAGLVCGALLVGCSSGAVAAPPDTGVVDGGSDAGSDGALDADGSMCGASDDAPVQVAFELPLKAFTVDSQAWMIPPSNSVATTCGSGAIVADCCNPPAPAAPPDCATTPVACEAGLCTVKINVTIAQDVDLRGEVPVLSNLDQALCDVTLGQLRFAATSTLNVSLPPLQLYLGAGGIRDPAAAGVQAFGTIPAIPAGSSTSGDVIRRPETDLIFATYAREVGTPFTLLISATVSVPSGSPPPSGTLTLTISGQASATL